MFPEMYLLFSQGFSQSIPWIIILFNISSSMCFEIGYKLFYYFEEQNKEGLDEEIKHDEPIKDESEMS